MPNETVRISELNETENLSDNDLLEMSSFDETDGQNYSKKITFSRFAQWVNTTLGNLIEHFTPRKTLTEAIDELFNSSGGLKLNDLLDVSINESSLEPRVNNERFHSSLVYDPDARMWTNEVYPFIEYEGIIRGSNKTPTIYDGQDEHIIIPAGVNVYTHVEVFVHTMYYGNFPTSIDFVDVQSAQGDPKPKKVNIVFSKSPYEMTQDDDSYMYYKLRIWT